MNSKEEKKKKGLFLSQRRKCLLSVETNICFLGQSLSQRHACGCIRVFPVPFLINNFVEPYKRRRVSPKTQVIDLSDAKSSGVLVPHISIGPKESSLKICFHKKFISTDLDLNFDQLHDLRFPCQTCKTSISVLSVNKYFKAFPKMIRHMMTQVELVNWISTHTIWVAN